MALLSSILSGEFSIMNYLLLFIIGLLTYVATFYIRYFNRQNPLPGPLPIPIFGNALSNPGDPGVWVKQLRSVYGDVFEIYMGTKRIVVLCRGDLVKKLLFSPMRLSSPSEGLDELGVSKGGTLLNTDHDEWSYNRRFLHKTIATPNLAKEAVESTQVLFQEMESLWERLDKGQEIDLIGWFPRFTFDNIIFLTTTLKIHALVNYYNSINPKNKVVPPEGTLPNSEDYVKSIETYFESAAFFALAPKVVRNLPGIRNVAKMFKDNKNWLVSSVLGVVKSRRDQIENSKEDLNTNDLLTQLLTINTEKDVTHNIADNKHTEKMSDNDVVANITDPIGGGTLTVANTICFIIYHLAHHPKVRERMVKELDSVLGNGRNSHITFNQMDKLVYTDAVIKEVMRIYPTMPLNLRSNLHPDDVPGYTFPVNTQFIIGTEEIHNSSDWTDPDEFYPDRWLDNTFDIKQRKDSYFQFGAGVRICPGRYLGLAEIKTLLALLYRKYDIELVDKVSPLQYNFKLVKACKELKVKIKPRIED